jgi:hypothetical protein
VCGGEVFARLGEHVAGWRVGVDAVEDVADGVEQRRVEGFGHGVPPR